MKFLSKKLTPKQQKIAQVIHKFKEGDLHSGKTETIVTNPKQAIAIALSEAEETKK
jgi:transposase